MREDDEHVPFEADDERAEDDEADDEGDDEHEDDESAGAEDDASSWVPANKRTVTDVFRLRAATARAKARVEARQTARITGSSGPSFLRTDAADGKTVLRVVDQRGRSSDLILTTPLATAAQFDRIRTTINKNAETAQRAFRANARGLRALAGQQAAAERSLTERLTASDSALANRMVESEKKKALARKRATKFLKRCDSRSLREARIRALSDNAVLLTALPVYETFGERGDIFGTNNLTITALLLGLLYGDEAISMLGGSNAKTAANVWSYLAPIAMPLLGFLLLRNKKDKDYTTPKTAFFSGRTAVAIGGVGGTVTVPIEGVDGRDLTNMPAMATPISSPIGDLVEEVKAVIVGETLQLEVVMQRGVRMPPFAVVEVSYFVDLRGPKKAA